jgi:CheY-like chemotaxis protein
MAENKAAKCKILVVDDVLGVRTSLSELLTDEGYAVRLAANEGEAWIAVVQESFDFALIDVRLHGDGEEDESGLSLAMAFRTLNPQIRVILLTRYPRTKQIVRAIRYYGVVDFIEKTPDVAKEVLETIAKAQKETRQSRFGKTGDTTRLTLSLTAGQPMGIRARGRHVCSLRSRKVLHVELERYARRTELARKDIDDLRFRVRGIGCDLWRDIFTEYSEAGEAYGKARGTRRQSFSLLFETSREFLRLPLEFMRPGDSDEYLVLKHPLARFIYNATPEREPISPSMLARTKKLRILIIASNTTTDTLPPIKGVDAETQELCEYLECQDLIPVSVTLIPTEQATYERIRAELKKPDYDIIHYAGHGSYNAVSPEKSYLYFWAEENKQGGVVPMKASELKMLLEYSGARLVYLSSCYGTATGSEVALLDDDFLGLADAVAQAGVPSVLGFRWPVSDDGALKLALALYESLLEQGSPEVALWDARRELAALDRDDPTWLSPILIHQV